MEYRLLGKTEIEVSSVGLGCWPMAGTFGGARWTGVIDEESIATIQHAETLGVNLLDSAEGYGAGHSEEIIGKALKGRRDRYVIATKVAPVTGDSGTKARLDVGLWMPARAVCGGYKPTTSTSISCTPSPKQTRCRRS